MIEGLVSVIIPVHNRAELLREAIGSVLRQTYRQFEIIIVDDGSTDETPAAIADLVAANQETIRSVRQPQRGPGLAREGGRGAARGEYIQYLDSDDVLLPEKLGLQVAALRSNPQCDVAYGRTRYRSAGGGEIAPDWKRTDLRGDTMYPAFLESRCWETSTPLYRASICDAAGPWSDLWLEEDWEYDCRIAALGARVVFVDAWVAEHRDHGEGRLSRGERLDAARLGQRASAHALMFGHAMRAGIDPPVVEMQIFARRLFLLSRQCGAAGLVAESKQLFEMARRASGDERAKGRDFRMYRGLAGVVGWRGAGVLAELRDR
ncbi:MAG TPA: glycosyltransferase family A protein, partial [Thermoanaerobaculia bacterium]|nr:glycosyltransferase family A protein [Thermoanaerobaculia bacterium]